MLTNVSDLQNGNGLPNNVIDIGQSPLSLVKELTFEGGGESFVMALPTKDADMYQVGETYCLSVFTTTVREGSP